MNKYLESGIIIVNLALISYTIFFLKKKKGLITSKTILYLILGVCFDLTATVLMIIGSHKTLLTLHGIIGYTALIGMIIEAGLVVKYYQTKRVLVGKLLIYTRIIYFWWIIVYILGLVLVMKK